MPTSRITGSSRAGFGQVGCSGGALYAAMTALGWDLATAERQTKELWTRDITRRRNTRALLSAILPQVFRFDERFGLVDDRIVLERLRMGFGDARIENARIPLYLTATDFHTGEQVVGGPVVGDLFGRRVERELGVHALRDDAQRHRLTQRAGHGER